MGKHVELTGENGFVFSSFFLKFPYVFVVSMAGCCATGIERGIFVLKKQNRVVSNRTGHRTLKKGALVFSVEKTMLSV